MLTPQANARRPPPQRRLLRCWRWLPRLPPPQARGRRAGIPTRIWSALTSKWRESSLRGTLRRSRPVRAVISFEPQTARALGCKGRPWSALLLIFILLMVIILIALVRLLWRRLADRRPLDSTATRDAQRQQAMAAQAKKFETIAGQPAAASCTHAAAQPMTVRGRETQERALVCGRSPNGHAHPHRMPGKGTGGCVANH